MKGGRYSRAHIRSNTRKKKKLTKVLPEGNYSRMDGMKLQCGWRLPALTQTQVLCSDKNRTHTDGVT